MKIVNFDFIHIDASQSEPYFHLFTRNEDGSRIHNRDPTLFPSYFYVPAGEEKTVEDFPQFIKKSLVGVEPDAYESILGERLSKVSFGKFSKEQFRISRDWSGFTKTFEDDVLYQLRYLIDKDISYDKNQRIMYIDIETMMGTNITNADKPVIAITVFDSFRKKYVSFVQKEDQQERIEEKPDWKIFYFDNERRMLVKFLDYFQVVQPDIITGWFVNGFDLPYLIQRSRRLRIDDTRFSCLNKIQLVIGNSKDETHVKLFGHSIVDLLKIYRKLTYDNKPDNYRLSTIAQHILGDDKVHHDGIEDMYLNNLPKLLEYNKKDVELCVRIDEKAKLLDYCLTIQQIVPIPLEYTLENSKIIDVYLLKKFHNKKVFPSRRKNVRTEFEGALTGKLVFDANGKVESKDPDALICHNTMVFDYAGLYPNIYRTFNISPDTLSPDGDIIIDDLRFNSKKEGLIPSVLEELLLERKKIEKMRDLIKDTSSIEYYSLQNKQGGLKAIINSIYGVLGYRNFRLYDTRIPRSITYIGRQCLIHAWKAAEKHGYTPRYSDTDSVFISFPDAYTMQQVVEASKKLCDEINIEINNWVKTEYPMLKNNYLSIECEKAFESLIMFGVKKKYYGLLGYKKGKYVEEFFGRGVEIVRRDTPKPFKPILKNLMKMVMKKEDPKIIKEYLIKEKSVISLLTPWEIGVTKQINKRLDDYGGFRVDGGVKPIPQHIRATIFSNKFLGTEFGKADNPKMLFIKDTQQREDVCCIDEDTKLPPEITVDYDMMFQKFVYDKLNMFEKIKGINIAFLQSEYTSLMSWM